MEIDALNADAGGLPEATTPAPEPTAIEPEIEATIEDDGPIDLDAPDEEANPDEAQEGETDAEPDTGPELIDFELEPGKTVKAPKELEPFLMRHADYTRKTQEAAALRKEVEAEKAFVEQSKQLSDEEVQSRAVLFNIDSELQKYQQTNWQEMMENDPLGAQSEWMRYQQLEKARSQVLEYKMSLETQRSQITEQETANRMRATAEFAKKSIPGFSPELDAKITEFAVRELGTTREWLMNAITPQIYKMMHMAFVGSQALSKSATAKPSTPVVQPTKTVSTKGNAAITKDPDDMSMSEYVEWRQAQMRRARR